MGHPRQRRELLDYLAHLRSLPEDCREIVRAWPDLKKSPFSRSFYSSRDKRWDFAPDGCERVSDHWNFRSPRRRRAPDGGTRHCPTDRPVPNGSHWAHAVYDAAARVWRVREVWKKA